MRLQHLSVSGFGAFRERTELDFDDSDFFALVGPTGSGKSTVIDAVCFALYGAVPRYDDQRTSRYVMSLGAAETKVSLRFSLGATGFVATRVLRRTARGPGTKEARLERLEADGSTTVLAGAEREMNAAVEVLLGLRFDDFIRCVVLPQGDFARFLRAKGEDRRDLLLRLLNLGAYLDVGRRAGQVAESAAAAAKLGRQRLEDLAGATPAALAAARQRAAELRALGDEAARERSRIEELVRLERDEQRHEQEARAALGLLSKIAVPEEARQHGRRMASARQRLAAAAEELEAARRAREKAALVADDLPDPAALEAVAGAHVDLAACAEKLRRVEEEAAEAAGVMEEADRVLADAEAVLEGATSALEALRAEHVAAGLAVHLVVGEPCPVCRQVVRALPEGQAEGRSALDAAEQAEAQARRHLHRAREVATKAATRRAERDGALAELRHTRDRLAAQVAGHPDPAALAELLERCRAARRALDAARRHEDDRTRAHEAAQRALEELADAAASLQADFDSQRDPVAFLGCPAPQRRDLVADWDALVRWARSEASTQEAASKEAWQRAAQYREEARARTQALAARCAALGVGERGDVVEVLQVLAEAAAAAEAQVAAIEAGLEEAARLRAEVERLDEEAAVASTLRTWLRADRFPEWLVHEALEMLVAEASTTLRQLTADGFSLTLGDREFMVIDHANADELRSARTLSGGETFQASLALALALSSQVRSLAAEGAPQLDSLFLDEGFGTLDPETLETVASTIENLGQSGRMIGVVTHVRELAERVPVRFEVRKGPRSATVEKRTA